MNIQYLVSDSLNAVESLDYPSDGVVIADEKLIKLYPHLLAPAKPLPTLSLKAGERYKTKSQLDKIYGFFAENRVSRSTIVHVFGGGTITDLAAYAASSYKRGTRLWLYPSTFLGMIDAAIGGKTGYNHLGIKNLIGSFYPAEQIFIYPPFLDSLAKKELRQGWAEVLKYSLLEDSLQIPDLQRIPLPQNRLLMDCAMFKMEICANDPFDLGERRLLNLGHSFGHALESASSFRIPHGDAVVMGIYFVTDLSHKLGQLDSEMAFSIYDWLEQYPMPIRSEEITAGIDKQELYTYLMQDKKNSGLLTMILPVGDSFEIVELSLDVASFGADKP